MTKSTENRRIMKRANMLPSKHLTAGIPFVITEVNRDEWKGQSGVPARGLLVDVTGARVVRMRRDVFSLAFLSECIAAKDGPGTYARSVLEDVSISRNIRNRPRLKALLRGEA